MIINSILSLILLITLIICLALLVLERGDKLVVSLTGAGVSIAAGPLPYWQTSSYAYPTLLPDGINSLLSFNEPD